MTNKKKKPSPVSPSVGKRITPPEVDMGRKSTNDERPIFSFYHHGKEYCITGCKLDQQATFAKHLYQLSQKTWRELTLAPKTGMGSEIIIQRAIKVGLPSVVTPDVKLLSFRCSSDGRIVGFRDNEIFHIIWIDFDKTLYDHGS